MEERQDSTKNVKILLQTLKEEKLKKLGERVKTARTKASSIVKKLNEKEAEMRKKAMEADLAQNSETIIDEPIPENKTRKDSPVSAIDGAVSAAESAAVSDSEKVVKSEKPKKAKTAKTEDKKEAKKSVEKSSEPASEEGEKTEISEGKVSAPKKSKAEPVVKKQDSDIKSAPEKVEKVEAEVKPAEKTKAHKENVKAEEKPVAEKIEQKSENKDTDSAAKQPVQAKTEEKTAEQPKKKSILSFIVRKADPEAEKRDERPRSRGIERYNDKTQNGSRLQRGDQTKSQKPFGDRNTPFSGNRPSIGGLKARPQEVVFVPPKDNKPLKKKNEKSFDDKRAINNKKSHIKELTVADFDENKTGYRKVRKPKQKKEEQSNYIKIEKAVITKEVTPIKELSEKFGISAVEITKRLFKEGITKTINDSIDFDTAAFIAADLGIDVTLKLEKSAEELMNEGFIEENDDASLLIKRPPIVTVMGHVDHGKTSLLDKIRSANVAEGEAGGITQHIGAYSVEIRGNKITFIDTPGHAAFTAMRARGAQVTDIAIIVVAADDGIKPQTIEAINHAKAAGVSIIVAANKIDKPHVDLDRVRQQLSEQGILVEDWGGDVIMVPVSAKTGEGIEKLLESILLVAEMAELKANPNRKARGTVIEAKLDKGKGPLATVLVQNGTLHVGDNIVAGTVVGRVRAMINEKGSNVKEAGPSTAVSVLGLEDVPNAGDALFAVDEEKLSKLVAEERKNKEREEMIRSQQKVSLDDLFSKISEGQLKNLNLIIKADVQGSAEAVKQSLLELSNEEVKVNVLHAAVGAINETDVTLAESSNAIIIGFNVRPDAKAKVQAERSHIDVKLYRIIYDAIDDVKKAMKGMLAPKFTDVYTGKAEVRDTFKITGVGMVAGCYVTDGKIVRSAKLRIYRNDVMICEGNVLQLKRFKDEVKEVNQGYECGISIEGFNDIKVGDIIESYIVEETKQ